MRVVVIGGTGHIGSYLVPRLVRMGHEVTVLTRGTREPYHPDGAWAEVRRIQVDRDAEDAAGTFGPRIAAMDADAVIDLVCFTPASAQALVEALRGHTGHLLHCGTIWVHGPSTEVPVTEDAPRRPFGDYGVNKAAIEDYLLRESRAGGVPATILHAGHIVGPGWPAVNPAGHFNPEVFGVLARGERLTLPNFGLETVHHVHADDVAQAFQAAMERRSAAVGESFHVCSPRAITLRGYAEAVSGWFGHEAKLSYLPFDEWKATLDGSDAQGTYDHIAHSPSISIDKARQMLGYAPRYSSLQAVREAVAWLADHGTIDTGGRRIAA